ncbi:MAG: protein kinase [Candidatus Obscuribacterales bacterium]|nr:protein kinase [Candidatus Obscuribacterales bacterium]
MDPSSYEDLQVGDRIAGRYEILALLGKGSMGVVYKAKHDILGRVVAIKMLPVQRMTDDRSKARFEREARASGRLSHPNLISVIDFGYTTEGVPYLIMDYVDGISLYHVLRSEKRLEPSRLVKLFAQVCDAVYHAHERGVIHRDLKPANILVVKNTDGSESVKIVDLGVAKIVQGEGDEVQAITRTGEVCGSPVYLSPEQCMYLELGPSTDIYSLGVCLYEALTGAVPLRGETVYDTLYLHVHQMPQPFRAIVPDLAIPTRLEEVVFRCLDKEPARRYQTMAQVKYALLDSIKAESTSSAASAATSAVHVLSPSELFASQERKSLRKSVLPQADPQVKMTEKVQKQTARPATTVIAAAALLIGVLIAGTMAYINLQNERISQLESQNEKAPTVVYRTQRIAKPQTETPAQAERVVGEPALLSVERKPQVEVVKVKALNPKPSKDGSSTLALAAVQMQQESRTKPKVEAEAPRRAVEVEVEAPEASLKPKEESAPAAVSPEETAINESQNESTSEAMKLAEQGRTSALSHDFFQASQKFKQAHQLEPGNAYFASCLAHSLTTEALQFNRQGDYAQAVAKQKEALSLSPKNQLYISNLQKFRANMENLGSKRLESTKIPQ